MTGLSDGIGSHTQQMLDLPRFQKCSGAAVGRVPAADIIWERPHTETREDERLTESAEADAASHCMSLLEVELSINR